VGTEAATDRSETPKSIAQRTHLSRIALAPPFSASQVQDEDEDEDKEENSL
jgi:hypothetical protein